MGSYKMTRQYNVETNEKTGIDVIWYEENGVRYSFLADPSNSDYQRYLNPEAEQSTPIVIDETSTK
jgi:hypothetical protein